MALSIESKVGKLCITQGLTLGVKGFISPWQQKQMQHHCRGLANLTLMFFFVDSGPKAISDVKKYQEALRNAQDVLSNATDTLSHRNMFSILIVSAMLIFVMSPVIFPVTDSSSWSLHHIGGKCLHVARIITTIILSGFMFYLIFNVREEYSAYKNIQQMIDIQMKQINPRKRMNGKSGL